MGASDFTRVQEYASSARAILKRAGLPPLPQFYDLFYTYVTGVDPALNARINALLTDQEKTIPLDIAEKLCGEFLKAPDLQEQLSNVSAEISVRIDAVSDAIDNAMASTNLYSGSLQAASGDLSTSIDHDTLRVLVNKLLQQTQQMQRANLALEKRLDASRGDIGALQRDLETLRRETLLDPLTGTYNRRGFDQGLQDAIEKALKDDTPLALLLLDIDHFKSFNDRHGHQTGDQVIRLVATTIKASINDQDLAARYGGEEFAIVLPSRTQAEAYALAEALREAIHAKELLKRSTNKKLGRVSASFGLAMLEASDSPSTLIERADRCLYRAKNKGRNMVVTEDTLLTDAGDAA